MANLVTINEETNIVTVVSDNFTIASSGGDGTGDVVGPASATDNAIARFNATTGKLIQNSAATIADTTGDITAGKFNGVTISGSGTIAISTYTLTVAGTASVSGTNTGDLTLAGTPDYITISGQVITRGLIDLTTDVTGSLPVANGGTGLTSLGTANQVLRTNAGATATEWTTLTGGGNAQTADPLSQFAATTSLQLAGVISDETGSGALVFGTSPTIATPAITGNFTGTDSLTLGTASSSNGQVILKNETNAFTTTIYATSPAAANKTLSTPDCSGELVAATAGTGASTTMLVGGGVGLPSVWTSATGSGSPVRATSPTLTTPDLGTPSAGILTNCTGTASGLTAGNVTTNANLTGAITSIGNTTSLGSSSFTLAQLNTAVSDANVAVVSASNTFLADQTIRSILTLGEAGVNGGELNLITDTTAIKTQLIGNAATTDKTIEFPDASGTVALIAATQTLTNKTISGASNTLTLTVDQVNAGVFAADAGANDTYTATLSPAPSAYVTGNHYRFKANTANTGAATINLNSLGAKTIVKVAGGITTTLADNDIRAGQWVDLVYDGTNMQMQSTLGNAASGGGSAADPTGTVGLSAVNGVASTFLRSDGAPALSQAIAPTWTDAHIFSKSGAASTSAVRVTGVPFAGTGTTSFPLVYINDANATASTTLSTSGTYFGINGDGSQDLMNLMKDGASMVKSTSAGFLTAVGGVYASSGNVTAGFGVAAGPNYSFSWSNSSKITDTSDGVITLTNNALTSPWFSRLNFGGSTNSHPSIGRDTVNGFTFQSAAGTSTWNDASTANSGTVANRYLVGIAAPTLTSTGTSVTDTVASTVYIGGAPTASTNTTITTPYALNVNAGVSKFGGPMLAAGYTVAGLPSTAATGKVTGAWAYVTDALAPTYGATVTAGGSVVTPVFYDGTNWTCR